MADKARREGALCCFILRTPVGLIHLDTCQKHASLVRRNNDTCDNVAERTRFYRWSIAVVLRVLCSVGAIDCWGFTPDPQSQKCLLVSSLSSRKGLGSYKTAGGETRKVFWQQNAGELLWDACLNNGWFIFVFRFVFP